MRKRDFNTLNKGEDKLKKIIQQQNRDIQNLKVLLKKNISEYKYKKNEKKDLQVRIKILETELFTLKQKNEELNKYSKFDILDIL